MNGGVICNAQCSGLLLFAAPPFVVCLTEWINSHKLACEGYVGTYGRILVRHMVNTNNPSIWEAKAGGCKLPSCLGNMKLFSLPSHKKSSAVAGYPVWPSVRWLYLFI